MYRLKCTKISFLLFLLREWFDFQILCFWVGLVTLDCVRLEYVAVRRLCHEDTLENRSGIIGQGLGKKLVWLLGMVSDGWNR